MNRRAGLRLIDKVDRRTELARVNQAIGTIPAGTKVDAELIGYLPGVLQIEAEKEVDLVQIGHDRNRNKRRNLNTVIFLEDERSIVRFHAIFAQVKAGAESMGTQAIVGVFLERVGEVAGENAWRNTLIDQIPDRIGIESLLIVVNGIRELVIDVLADHAA